MTSYASCVLAALEGSPRPLKRRELADECGPHNCKIATAERHVRAAIEELVNEGYPVVSDGAGFSLASNPAQFERAIRWREKAVAAESQKLRRLRRMLQGMQYTRQFRGQSLPFEAGR